MPSAGPDASTGSLKPQAMPATRAKRSPDLLLRAGVGRASGRRSLIMKKLSPGAVLLATPFSLPGHAVFGCRGRKSLQ
jgi:hypothetical protein